MHEIFEISFLDELGEEVSQSQIKAESNITSESQMNALESFRCVPPLSYFKKSDQNVRREVPISRGCITQKALEDLSDNTYKSYVNAYEAFKTWQEYKEVNSFAEPVLLDYFRELSKKYKPKSLWNWYAMLRSTILSNHNISISEYSQLLAFLKEKSYGYQRKKSKVFTAEDVNKFLVEAPDFKYLGTKSVLVFGVIGASRGDKILNVKTDYVTDNGNEIVVKFPDEETRIPYIIEGQFAQIVRKYMKLRPITATTDRFFLQYENGKCTNQVIGRKVVLRMPKDMAKFLKLPESEAYTGYSFRSSSISADTSVGIETRHGQWASSKLAEGNLQKSLGYKEEIGNFIPKQINLPSTSNVFIASHENASERITPVTITSSESSSLVNEETINESTPDMSDNSSSSENEVTENSNANDDTRLNKNQRTKEPKRKRKKRPKRQKEIDWYDEECLSQIKLTTDMFRRFSKMREDDKMKMLSEFSMHRVDLFKKYFAAMNTVTIDPINTPITTASINTAAHNGVTVPNGVIYLD